MPWLELAVEADPEAVEAVAEILSRVAPGGVAVEPAFELVEEGLGARLDPTRPAVVRAYVPASQADAATSAVDAALGHLRAFGLRPIGELRTRVVDEAVPHPAARLVSTGPRAVALCRLGTLELLDATLDGRPAAAPELLRALGPDVPLGDDAGSASGRPHAKIRE